MSPTAVDVPATVEIATGEPAAVAAAVPGGAVQRRIGRFDYRWVALVVVLGGTVMSILDATVVNVAIRTLQDAFDVRSYNDIAWVVTGYALAQGAVIPLTGWATDRFGTKRLYLVSLVLFTAASALCGAAWSLPTLILFRVLQGIGGGMLMPIGMTIILRAFGPSQMGRVMGYFGLPMLVAPALGPVLGGWFSQDFSWRLVFYINVPVGALAVVGAWLFLVETPTSRAFRLDVVGAVTATTAVLALLYGLNESTSRGWGSPLVVGMLVGGGVLFAVFVARQLTAAQPLLHLSLFRDPTFSWSIVLGFSIVTAMFGTVFLLPTYLQAVHGYGPLETGIILLPQALAAAVLMPIGGRLTDRIGPRPVVLTGLAFLALSGLVLATVTATTSLVVIVAAMVLRGIAMALAMMPGMTAGLARIPRHLTSRASSITNTAQRVGMSIGIAVLVTFLAAQTAPAVASTSCAPSPQVVSVLAAQLHTAPTATAVCGALASAANASAAEAGGAGTGASTGDAATDAFLTAFRDDVTSSSFDRTFLFVAVVAALGFIPAFFLKKPERESRGAAATVLVEA